MNYLPTNIGSGRYGIRFAGNTLLIGVYGSRSTVAGYHASGAGTLPQRDFIRQALMSQRRRINTLGKEFARRGDLDGFGTALVNMVREFVLGGNVTPSNKPSTIKAKGGDTVMMNTGTLLSQVSYMIV